MVASSKIVTIAMKSVTSCNRFIELFPTEPVDRDQGDYIEDQSANPPIHLTEQRTYTTLRPAQSQSPRCRLKKATIAYYTVQNYFYLVNDVAFFPICKLYRLFLGLLFRTVYRYRQRRPSCQRPYQRAGPATYLLATPGKRHRLCYSRAILRLKPRFVSSKTGRMIMKKYFYL